MVVALCWLIVVYDGYDLIIYGTTIDSLLAEDWGLTTDSAGWLGSVAFLGMLVGALCGGAVADILGRRKTIIFAIIFFTIFTGLCGWATSAWMFGALRFTAGLGLGALVPSANAISAEFVRDKYRAVASTAMMSGVPIGGSIAAIVGMKVLTDLDDWPTLYFIAFSAVVLVAAAWFFLPESPSWLRGQGRVAEAEKIEAQYGLEPALVEVVEKGGVFEVFQSKYFAATMLFFIATTATMFAWYGLGTWLPKLTAADDRFDLGSDPLTYLLALNLGAVVVSAVTAALATRFGAMRVAVFTAFTGALSLAALLTFPSSIWVVYALLILAGVGSHGTLVLMIAAIANHFPARMRATALGTSLGGGRVGAVMAPTVAGWLLANNPDSAAPSIMLFAGASALAAVLLFITARVTRPVPLAPLPKSDGAPTLTH